MANGKFVAYYRTSTKTQDLGIDAQKDAVRDYLNGGDWNLIGEFEEQESGKNSDRRALKAALDLCRKKKAKLIIAKLDRLARNVHFISGLMESKVPFVCCDNPHATPLTVHILAAVAEDEAKRISDRTKAALATLKAKGTQLGNRTNLAEARAKGGAKTAEKADAFAEEIMLRIEKIRASGITTTRGIAAELNERGIKTASGKGMWTATQVHRVLARRTTDPEPNKAVPPITTPETIPGTVRPRGRRAPHPHGGIRTDRFTDVIDGDQADIEVTYDYDALYAHFTAQATASTAKRATYRNGTVIATPDGMTVDVKCLGIRRFGSYDLGGGRFKVKAKRPQPRRSHRPGR